MYVTAKVVLCGNWRSSVRAVRISPFVVMQSGAPFDITAGNDLYGTTLFNARPGIATDPNKPGLIQTAYGMLDPNPTSGERLLSRNFGRGPGQYNMNPRIAKVIGFGKEHGSSGGDARPGGGGGNPMQAATGRGLGGLIGTPTTAHRFNLSIGLSVRNLLNHTNPGLLSGTSRRRTSDLPTRLPVGKTAKASTRRPTTGVWNRRSNSPSEFIICSSAVCDNSSARNPPMTMKTPGR